MYDLQHRAMQMLVELLRVRKLDRYGLRGDHDAASIARLRRFPQGDFGGL